MGSTATGSVASQMPLVDGSPPPPPPTGRRSPSGFFLTALAAAPAVTFFSLLLGGLLFRLIAQASGWESGNDADEGNGMAGLIIVFLTCGTIGCGVWLAIVRWTRDRMGWPGRWGMTFVAVLALAPTSLLLGLMSVEGLERLTGAPTNGALAVASLIPGVCVGLAAACVVGGIIRTGVAAMWIVLVAVPVFVWVSLLTYWFVVG